MSKWSNSNKLIWPEDTINYCMKCWADFTTLTQQERENLKDRAKVFQSIKKETSVFT